MAGTWEDVWTVFSWSSTCRKVPGRNCLTLVAGTLQSWKKRGLSPPFFLAFPPPPLPSPPPHWELRLKVGRDSARVSSWIRTLLELTRTDELYQGGSGQTLKASDSRGSQATLESVLCQLLVNFSILSWFGNSKFPKLSFHSWFQPRRQPLRSSVVAPNLPDC